MEMPACNSFEVLVFRPIIEYRSVATKIILDQYLPTPRDLLHTMNMSTIH